MNEERYVLKETCSETSRNILTSLERIEGNLQTLTDSVSPKLPLLEEKLERHLAESERQWSKWQIGVTVFFAAVTAASIAAAAVAALVK